MDTNYKIIKLKNGIKILYIPFFNSKLIKIKVKILHGEINENKNTAEFGHLLEHMNSKFTSCKYPNAKQNLERINNYGGSRNASITNYFTEYYVEGSVKQYDFYMDLILNSVIVLNLIKEYFSKKNNLLLKNYII